MNPIVLSSYQPAYIAISFLIAVAGSFVAIMAANRIKQPDGSFSTANTLTAGLALGGIGVWAMHFVGMLALKLDLANSYAMVETGVSLVAAILAASLALGFVARAPERLGRMLVAGALLGMSVVVMHYLGMYGMKFGGYIQWDYALIAASIAIAIVAATAALWLAFNTATLATRFGAALVMGVAVCAMHYTGMAAAEFVCTTANRSAIPQGFGYVSSFSISSLVIIAALSMGFLIAMSMLFQPNAAAARQKLQAKPSRS
ncbi:MAG: MHYT domain-containing protein [Polaromonas sp.]|uniref:MHYT domain-containing protein n=1 Tax=Polaromonas sp. TaxID=1869339 RepID=UPI004036A14A